MAVGGQEEDGGVLSDRHLPWGSGVLSADRNCQPTLAGPLCQARGKGRRGCAWPGGSPLSLVWPGQRRALSSREKLCAAPAMASAN